MDRVAITFAKLAAVLKAARTLVAVPSVRYVDPGAVLVYFDQSSRLFEEMKSELPELYGDFVPAAVPAATPGSDFDGRGFITRAAVDRLIRDIEFVLEVRANSELGTPEVRREDRVRRVWLILAGLFVLTGTLVLVFFGKEIDPYLHKEVFKLLAQLIILAGIGGLGSLVLGEISTSRERREANRTLLRSTLSDIVSAYNEIKAIRRLLRADAVRPNYKHQDAYVLREPYEALLRRLNDAQLELETQLRLVESSKAQFPNANALCKLLSDAEEYVGGVISEWEDRLGSFKAKPDENKLADFSVLCCFLAKAKRSFKPSFAIPLAQVFAIINTGISE